MRSVLVLVVVFLGAGLVGGRGGVSAKDAASAPWLLPVDLDPPCPDPTARHAPRPTQTDAYHFAWKSFIALNWPHAPNGEPGQPHGGGALAPINAAPTSPGPVVWQSYPTPEHVFTKHTMHADDGMPILDHRTGGYTENLAAGINQPYTHAHHVTGPLADLNGNFLRVQVTMSPSFACYVRHFRYDDPSVQIQAVQKYLAYVATHDSPPPPVKDGEPAVYFQPLPTGTESYLTKSCKLAPYNVRGLTEVKAAWKVLEPNGKYPDVVNRFYRRLVRFRKPDGSLGKPTLVGLVGLHVHRVTPTCGHLASTFEHVDNTRVTPLHCDTAPIPTHPNLNPGPRSATPPPYRNGYVVNGQQGRAGLIPKPILKNQPLPPAPRTFVSRVVPVPPAVAAINRHYQNGALRNSVWRYYRLIGAQNRNLDPDNRHLGPGLKGPQASNTQNLINTTLETYTQAGFSCARCHMNALPLGVTTPPPFEPKYDPLRVGSFILLQAAQNR